MNPGNLIDCTPPPNLSPLGHIQYLHDLLHVPIGNITLGDLISRRCGSLGDLKATLANLEIAIPLVDLVNESLEALGSNLSSLHGAVYDTNANNTAGFDLNLFHDHKDAIFKAIPQNSSPAVPVQSPAIYETLKSDFTAPDLPYSQSLDICRTYLCFLGTS